MAEHICTCGHKSFGHENGTDECLAIGCGCEKAVEQLSTPTDQHERETLANLIPLDLVHDRGREGFPQDAFEAADRILAAGFHRTPVGQSSASTDKSWRTGPPAGWHTFGTHANSTAIREIEFWGRDENGLPIWERPAPTDQDERETIARVVADFLCSDGYEITEPDYRLADRIIEARASAEHPEPPSDAEKQRDGYLADLQHVQAERNAAETKLARIKRLSDNEWSYGPDEFGVFKAALRAILNDKETD